VTTGPGSRRAGRVTARPAEILLVEDSPSDAAMTVHALGTYHRVHVVGDGEAALAFLHRKGRYTAAPKPDLILLDLNLPRVDGREVLDRINTDEHLRGIPVVILTTSSTDTDILRLPLGRELLREQTDRAGRLPPRDQRHRTPLAEPDPTTPGIPQRNSLTSHLTDDSGGALVAPCLGRAANSMAGPVEGKQRTKCNASYTRIRVAQAIVDDMVPTRTSFRYKRSRQEDPGNALRKPRRRSTSPLRRVPISPVSERKAALSNAVSAARGFVRDRDGCCSAGN